MRIKQYVSPNCDKCPLCCSHFAYGTGNPKAKYFFITSTPGIEDVIRGKILRGRKGKLLKRTLHALGYTLRDCYFSSLVWCRPEDRAPQAAIEACKNRLFAEIREVDPEYLILLGSDVCKVFFPDKTIRETTHSMLKWDKYNVRVMNDPGLVLHDYSHFQDFYEALQTVLKPHDVLSEEYLTEYTFLDTKRQILEVLETLHTLGNVTLDIETTTIDPEKGDIRLVGIGNETVVYEFTIIDKEIAEKIGELSHRCNLIVHEADMEYPWFKHKFDVELKISTDSILIHHWEDERKTPRRLKVIANRYLGIEDWSDKVNSEEEEYDITNAPLSVLKPYLAVDIKAPALLLKKWNSRIPEKLSYHIHTSRKALSDMTLRGIPVDANKVMLLYHEIENMAIEPISKIKEASSNPDTFNPESPLQLAVLLFDELGYEDNFNRSTKATTAMAELLYKYPDDTLLRAITTVREFRKMQSSSLASYYKFLQKNNGRIHPRYMQRTTETGRLSSKNPNAQQIPERGELARRFKNCFQLPGEEWEFAVFDYSQIEVFLMAVHADDKNLAKVLAGGDIYKEMASIFYRIPVDMVTPEQRQFTKPTVLGAQYDRSPIAIAKQWHVPVEIAKKNHREYFERFTGVRYYIDSCMEKVKEKGYVESLMGRRRRFPLWYPPHFMDMKREAINSPIQGDASDICLWAFTRISEMNLDWLVPFNIVHDAIYFYWRRARRWEAYELVKDIMLNNIPLELPIKLRVECKVGDLLGEVKKWKPDDLE